MIPREVAECVRGNESMHVKEKYYSIVIPNFTTRSDKNNNSDFSLIKRYNIFIKSHSKHS